MNLAKSFIAVGYFGVVHSQSSSGQNFEHCFLRKFLSLTYPLRTEILDPSGQVKVISVWRYKQIYNLKIELD